MRIGLYNVNVDLWPRRGGFFRVFKGLAKAFWRWSSNVLESIERAGQSCARRDQFRLDAVQDRGFGRMLHDLESLGEDSVNILADHDHREGQERGEGIVVVAADNKIGIILRGVLGHEAEHAFEVDRGVDEERTGQASLA